MRSLVVIPTYNEAENIENLLQSVLQSTDATTCFLVVDDGSPDGTGQIVDRLATAHSRIHILHRESKQGLGKAYLAGFQWGLEKGFEAIVEMDADFSHHPKYLPVLLKHLESNAVVVGSRNIRGGGTLNWGIGRKIVSWGGSLYSRAILGVGIRDFTGGFNGWRRGVLEAIDLPSVKSDGYSFQIELKYRAAKKGFKILEFPIIFEDRKVGKSKMSVRIFFEALLRVWSFRFKGAFFLLLVSFLAQAGPQYVVIVEKKSNQLFLTEYENDSFKTISKFHATVGKVKGDKEEEGDLKTPEGIYQITTKLMPPGLKPEFGKMAFYLGYPNAWDTAAGHTGFDIMLHATDDPARLKNNFDSKGCVVVENKDIESLEHYLHLQLTPVAIFDEWTKDYQNPLGDPTLPTFFKQWIEAWENKQLDAYINNYHPDFLAQHMGIDRWRAYKGRLNELYAKIEVKPTRVQYLRHPKYSVIRFLQNYHSTLKNGGRGHESVGVKTLFVVKDGNRHRILDEDFTRLVW